MNNLFKRLLSCFLILTFVFTSVPFAAFADETNKEFSVYQTETQTAAAAKDEVVFEPFYDFNPAYCKDEASAIASFANAETVKAQAPAVNAYNRFTNSKAAYNYITDCMVNRDSTITLYLSDIDLYYDVIDTISFQDNVFKHTGVPDEGDYLKWNWHSYSGKGAYYGNDIQLTYYMNYRSTAAQEREVTAKVNSLVNTFAKEPNNYRKLLAAYHWMNANIMYVPDYEYDNSYHHSTHSAITGKTVCQGYSSLFYRIALELGIDCRVVAGEAPGGAHGWNIVQLGNKYYHVDATWDDNSAPGYYSYFLRSRSYFDDAHWRWAEYDTAAFNKQYPSATSDFNPSDYIPSPSLTVKANASGNPKLTWTTLKNASKYQIYRSKTGKAGSYGLVKTVTSGTTWTDTNITKGQKYYYKVRAVYTNGLNSEYSAVRTITAKLAAPTNVTINNVATSGKIKLTWNKVSGATKYEIWRSKTGKDGSFGKIYTTSNTYYTNTNAEAGTKYYYKVKAVNGNSAAASNFSTVKSLRCDLAQVKNVTVKNDLASGKPKITWDAVNGAAKYEVYRSTTGKDGSFKFLVSTTSTSLINKNAVAGKGYYYKVKAVHSNSDANGVFSAVSSRILCDLARPDVTISLNAKGKPMLKWTPVDGVVKYEIYRSTTNKADSFKKIYEVAGTAKSYTNSKATKGVTYYYKVKAVHTNTNANSAFSLVKTIKSK
ncbi:MAG: fibronectin type III domain-containing protein [Oscillospiraceae bacterium]|nr:fibronectin type III domain-containing protein [Oscillospiraceae bacterium]